MILEEDLNCLIHPIDTTGPFQTSSATNEMVQGLALTRDAKIRNGPHIHITLQPRPPESTAST
jgi:hypothetical protein